MADFEHDGIAVFAISYDSVSVLAGFAEKHGIAYPLLSDEGSVVITRLGMLNDRVYEQHAAYGVAPREQHMGTPYPGVFLLDERGVVIDRRFQQSYRERETAVGLLEQGFGGHASTHGSEHRGGSAGVAVRAALDSETFRFFQRLWLTVELTVDPGLHIYGRPIPDGFVPLSVEVAPAENVTVGEPVWPRPHPFRIEGLGEQFQVYEGTVTLALPVTFTARDMGDQTVRVTVRYQACSDADCLMPAAVSLELPVRLAGLVS